MERDGGEKMEKDEGKRTKRMKRRISNKQKEERKRGRREGGREKETKEGDVGKRNERIRF